MKTNRVPRLPRRRAALVTAALLALVSAAGPLPEDLRLPGTPAALTLPATSPSPATSTPPAALTLPAPTGPRPVGLRTVELRDSSRRDPWVPGTARELMVSLWYPARSSAAPHARYVTARESAMILRQFRIGGVPADLLSRTRVHAAADAPPARTPAGGLPLVVLSPGFTLPRTSLTALAEDLASHGYAVASVDHPHEAAAITYPGGRVTGCDACRHATDGKRVAATRAADLSYVREELTTTPGTGRGGTPSTRSLPRLDPARVAVVGHSMGGAAAFEAVRTDPRFVAGVNLDGTFQSGATTPVDRPFLLLGADEHGRPGADRTWSRVWGQLDGRRDWLSVAGTGHLSFTDYGVLSERLGQAVPGASAGAAPAVDALRLTRRVVRAFLDEQLTPRAPSLVDPAVRHERRIHRYGSPSVRGPLSPGIGPRG
jgi:predicted dienelactone hydrolase